MKIFLVTDEFIAGLANPSFRAVVVASDESASRWVVTRQRIGPGMERVRDACVLCLGDTEMGEEAVLSYTASTGIGAIVKEHQPLTVEADQFFRVDKDSIVDPYPLLPEHQDRLADNVVTYWHSKNTGLLMRLTERTTMLPNYTGMPGVYSENETYAQYWRPGHNDPRVEYMPTESVKVEHFLARAESRNVFTLAEAHTIVSRLADARFNQDGSRELLGKLWDSFVSYTEVGSDKLATDLLLYKGQKLWFQAEKARDWIIGIPHSIALERNLNTDSHDGKTTAQN